MVRLHHDLIYAGEHPVNDAIPRPQAKVRKALTPLLEIRNLTKSLTASMPWMTSA
jgi:putrescine transport system ATP-binding protein